MNRGAWKNVRGIGIQWRGTSRVLLQLVTMGRTFKDMALMNRFNV